MSILAGICFAAHVFLFGQVTGSFALQSSADQCPHNLRQHSPTIPNQFYNRPLHNDSTLCNHDRFHRYIILTD